MPADSSPLPLHHYLTIAENHRSHIRYRDALQTLDTALQIADISPADLNFIHLRRLAYEIEYDWLYNTAQFALLAEGLDRAHNDAILRDDRPQISTALFLTARLHHFSLFEAESRDLDAVEQRWIDAYTAYASLDDLRGMAESLFYHGLLYQRFKADQDTAMEYFHSARDLIEYRDYPIELGEIMRHTGYVYEHRGNLIAAHACYEEAVAQLILGNFRVYLPLAHYALGMVLMAQERLDEAALHFEQALAIAQEATPNILHVGSLLGSGDFRLKTGDIAAARLFYQRAHDTAQSLHASRFVNIATEKLATLTSSG